MPIRTLALVCAAACATPPPPATTPANHIEPAPAAKTTSVRVPPFGDIEIEDGALRLMDHNNGDERVHIMTISAGFQGSKLSWADRPGPRTAVHTGTFPISAEEREEIVTWTNGLWELAPTGRHVFAKPDGARGFEWAIVVRRGNEVRVIEGGASNGADSPSEELLEGVIDFLDMHF